jgi:nitrite reductase/ring-hydroxylating ferredoxin subunit
MDLDIEHMPSFRPRHRPPDRAGFGPWTDPGTGTRGYRRGARPIDLEAGMDELVRAAAVEDIPVSGAKLFRHFDKRIALFRTGKGVFATDNRCPHEGYALVRGDVKDDVLTCEWHNWKFRLDDGACLFGGESVRSYPVEIRGGQVFVDVTDPPSEQVAPQLFASLLDAMGDVDVGRLARDTMRLQRLGTPLAELIRQGVHFGAPRAEYGWNHSLATLADCLNIAALFEGPVKALPVVQGLSVVSQTEVRRPERPRPDPIDPVAAYGSVEQALDAYPALVDDERAERAEGLLYGLLAAGADPASVRHALLRSITDHFLGYGHPMIYCQKSFELLDRIGWAEAAGVLGPMVPATVLSTRYDRLPYMRQFLAAWRAAELDLAALLANQDGRPGARRGDPRFRLDHLRYQLLDGGPAEAFEALRGALEAGAPVPALIDEVARAASARLGRFDIDLDTDDTNEWGWLDVTHTLTYTDALRWAWSVDPSPEVLRGLFHAAWFVQWTGRLDAKATRPVAAAPTGDAGEVLAAVRRRDPDGAVATVLGYQGPEEALERSLAQAAAEDTASAPIMVAHTVKTTRAAIMESRMLGQGRHAPMAAVARFMAAPKRERFVYQSTLEAIAFVQGRTKGDLEDRDDES